MTLQRPRIGSMVAPMEERDEDAYLNFVEGVRAFTVQRVDDVVRAETDRAVMDWAREHGHEPRGVREAFAALDTLPVLQSRRRLYRTSQEMFWKMIADSYHRREAELLAELDRSDRMGPGSVEYDPNFPIPDVYRRDIHIQPGGYTEDPLAGFIYHYGTKVFAQGTNDNDDRQRAQVAGLPEPQGGVRRVLDTGCAIGQATTAMKERWPQAEVWGIDIGAPMVRYAHRRAIELGIEVHFAQRLAEDTKFPDGYFDIVVATIMYHEVPLERQEACVAEARRILRPGGIYIVEDFATEMTGDKPLWEVLGYTDSVDNCEPYSLDFIHSDFTGKLKKYFSDVQVIPGKMGYNYPRATRICTA
jgi:ubiquinone/menaquinone biosynthesis C-methylase UbiE